MSTIRGKTQPKKEEKLQEPVDYKVIFLNDDYKGASNRAYYCVFHCIRSVLSLEQIDFKSHSAVISHFRKEYVKTNKFEIKLSDILGSLFQARNDSDYDDDFDFNKEDIEEQITNAEYFLSHIKMYLENHPGKI